MYHRVSVLCPNVYFAIHLGITAASITTPLAASWELPLSYNPPLWEECGNRYFAEVDYLLWYTHEEGLALSSNLKLASSSDGSFALIDLKQKDNFFRNKWNSGVRATVAFKPCQRAWDVRASYLYFTNKVWKSGSTIATSTVSSTQEFIFGSYFENAFLDNPVMDVRTKWSIDLNQVDIEFGREFYLSSDVTLRPFFGMRGVCVGQSYGLTLSAVNVSLSDSYTLFDPKTRFDGFGTKAGFDASLNLYSNLDLYGGVGGSLLWGRAKFTETVFQILDNGGAISGSTILTHQSYHTTVLNLDFAFGLRWNQWLDGGRKLLTFKLGWEEHLYSNMNRLQIVDNFFSNSQNDRNVNDLNVYRGDLSFSGFVFGVNFLY